MEKEKICKFCKCNGNIAACKVKGARQRGKYSVDSTPKCRPDPRTLTREQFKSLATPLLDEAEYMGTMLYNNKQLQGLPDGVHLYPDIQDSVPGTIIAEIEGGEPIGALGVYEGTIRNIAIDPKHKIILKLLLGIAKKHGAVRVEESISPDVADAVYSFYIAEPSQEKPEAAQTQVAREVEPAKELHSNCAAEIVREKAPEQITIKDIEQSIPAQVQSAIDAIQGLAGRYQEVVIDVGVPEQQSNKFIIPLIISVKERP